MKLAALAALAAVRLIGPVSGDNSAGATSGWVAIPDGWEGDVMFALTTGDNTGTSTHKIQTASDDSGTGAADVTFVDGTSTFTAVAGDNTAEVKVVERRTLSKYVKHVATVTTGPCALSSVMYGSPKYA